MEQKTVYKFTLEFTDVQDIKMQKGAKILSVGVQRGIVCIWALVEPNAQKENRRFAIVGTGCEMTLNQYFGKFIGTVLTEGDALVWHIFETE